MLSVCPAAVIAAPIERVWALLAEPASWTAWADVRDVRAQPPGSARPGQTVVAGTRALARAWTIRFHVEAVDVGRHRLRVRAQLPFGIEDRAEIVCVRLNDRTTRVQYG